MKAVLMADAMVGMAIVRWLVNSHRDMIAAVVVKGENDIFNLCKSNNIPVHLYVDSEKYINWLKSTALKFNCMFLVWWPYLLNGETLENINVPVYNTHPSYLPFNRGKHYNFWAIVEEVPFGVTIHRVEKGIDSGPIVAQEIIEFGWEDNGGTLYKKAQFAMTALFKKYFIKILKGEMVEIPQNLSKGSFHLAKELDIASCIDLDNEYKARHMFNLLRARTFSGRPACYFFENGQRYEVRIKIKRVENDD